MPPRLPEPGTAEVRAWGAHPTQDIGDCPDVVVDRALARLIYQACVEGFGHRRCDVVFTHDSDHRGVGEAVKPQHLATRGEKGAP